MNYDGDDYNDDADEDSKKPIITTITTATSRSSFARLDETRFGPESLSDSATHSLAAGLAFMV